LLLPRWNIADELRRGTLVNLFPEYRATASEYDLGAWLLYPTRSYLPLKARLFADYLKERFKQGPPAERGLPKQGNPRPSASPRRKSSHSVAK
jgi:DNA-binding transcriptional LysR family regulator